MMKRALAGCLLLLLGVVVGERQAKACTPPEGAPAETLVRMTFQGPEYTTPKNIGLILSAFAGPRTGESGVIAQAKIEVKSVAAGSAVIPGALRRLETQDNTYSEYSIWSWAPSDGAPALAPGKYSATLTFLKAPSGSEPTKFEFTVEDRTIDVPRPSMTTLEAARFPEPDPSAPAIQCKMTIAPSPCGDGGERSSESQSIPSRQRGVPRLNWQGAIPNQRDFPFLRMSARAFARTSGGIIVKEEKRSGISLNGSAVLAKADQYCIETTSWLLTNPAVTQVVEQCAPHGSLDLSISNAEQTTYAERVLQSCSRDAPILFPPGHTKDDPAGVGTGTGVNEAAAPSGVNESSGESGCSTSTSGSKPGLGVIALGLIGLTLLFKKRKEESARPR